MWESCVVTKRGAELFGKLSAIEITCAKFGISTVPDAALAMQTDVTAPMGKLAIADFKHIDGGFAVVIQAANTGIEEEYAIKQLGLYAKEKDGDEEILIAVTQDNIGDRVPAAAEMPDFSLQFVMMVEISNEAEITAVIDSNVAISRKLAEQIIKESIKPFEDHIKNKSNPHEVTKAQVGLGNVPNVSTNDQTPTYTVPAVLGELASGEKFGTAMGKIAKAVKELITHLADNVKHVTAAERTAWNGKAAGSHSHGAASQSANGFMSAADKAKLDGITAGANKYAHPVTSGNKHIPSGGSSGQILRWASDGTAVWGADNNTTYSNMGGASASAAGRAGLVPAPAAGAQGRYLRGDGTWQTPPDTNTTYSAATQSVNGLMSAADKKKLDGIAAGANAYAHPSYTARTGVPAANQTPAFGGTFSISQPVSDGSGHITGMNTRTVKIPDTNASASAAGLMSAADKNKMNEIKISGINVTYGKETIPRTTSGPISKTVTISHKTDIVFLWVLNHAAYRTLIVLNSYAGSENLAGSFTVNLSQSASSATLKFTGGTNLDTTVYYAAFRLS